MQRVNDIATVLNIYKQFPAWLTQHSPIFTEAWIKRAPNGNGYLVSHPYFEKDQQYETVYAAYEAAEYQGLHVAFDKALFVDGDVTSIMEDEHTPEEIYEYHLTHGIVAESADEPYAMLSRTFASWVYDVQADFEDFAQIRQHYLEHPHSFAAAYAFVEEHPIAWIRPGKQRTATIWMPHQDNLLEPYFEDDQGNVGEWWILETGEHEDPDYQRRYFDSRLSVFDATSPAEAYIRVAAKIEATFYPDGTRKEPEPAV